MVKRDVISIVKKGKMKEEKMIEKEKENLMMEMGRKRGEGEMEIEWIDI